MTGNEYIEIKGGKPLSGSVCVQGSKNAILPMLAASLLPEKGCSVIRNVPPLNDILVAMEIMRYVGATVDYFPKEKVVCVDATHVSKGDLRWGRGTSTTTTEGSPAWEPRLQKRMNLSSRAKIFKAPPCISTFQAIQERKT